jgi:predicted O-methyltransferase YrrM
MRPNTTDEVIALLEAHIDAAALGAALELGLFWLLEDGPKEVAELAQTLNVPLGRCRYWLQVLDRAGLLTQDGSAYSLGAVGREAIVDAYGQETWAFLARETRDRTPAFRDLAVNIRESKSIWEALGIERPDYFEQLQSSPEEARRFTRMLYEIHLPMAEAIADALDLSEARRLLDLGGGSGVVSLALLRKYNGLASEVFDIPNVCAAGRQIALENGMESRISYHPVDFRRDELPRGFDVVLDCDVGAYDEHMLVKLLPVLNPGGRLVIIDQFAPAPGVAPPARLNWSFQDSMQDPEFTYATVDEIKTRLGDVGFREPSDRLLPPAGVERWTGDWTIIEAVKW